MVVKMRRSIGLIGSSMHTLGEKCAERLEAVLWRRDPQAEPVINVRK